MALFGWNCYAGILIRLILIPILDTVGFLPETDNLQEKTNGILLQPWDRLIHQNSTLLSLYRKRFL